MGLKIAIVYCYPVTGEPHHADYAMRFLQSYHQFPPGTDHETIVVANGGPPDESFFLFHTLPGCSIFRHSDTGWDIGAYQAVCKTSTHDMLVFLGGSSYCRRPGWLLMMAGAFERLGRQNLYGVAGNTGMGAVRPHLRTTGFWCAPSLINRHPMRVTRPEQRYPFEHGAGNLTEWTRAQGLKAYVIDGEGSWEYPRWNMSANGYHRGNQSALLMGDRLTAPPFYAVP